MQIGSTEIGSTLFFIAEEGQANLGDVRVALDMIDLAADVGVDAIEFQAARAADFYVASHPGYERYVKREFSEAQYRELIARARARNVAFIASPLSHTLVVPLRQAGCAAFNVNASDLTNPDIIDAVAESGLPFFLSLPMATEQEIRWAITRIQRHHQAGPFGLAHGQHTMASAGGVPAADTALGCIATLARTYQEPMGFIDHTPHPWMPSVAVAAGAVFVSKHLIRSRSAHSPDWQICLEPDEMRDAVTMARAVWKSVHVSSKDLAPGEQGDRSIMRRSIVAARPLPSGTIVQRSDVVFKRPGTGLDPSQYEEVIGKTTRRNFEADDQLVLADLQT
ncbi:MAG: N-acetylneuraminate synthase family protein [bacterium]|nr:N-acetylneuraminate synthase family protein [bacterium]